MHHSPGGLTCSFWLRMWCWGGRVRGHTWYRRGSQWLSPSCGLLSEGNQILMFLLFTVEKKIQFGDKSVLIITYSFFKKKILSLRKHKGVTLFWGEEDILWHVSSEVRDLVIWVHLVISVAFTEVLAGIQPDLSGCFQLFYFGGCSQNSESIFKSAL